MENKIWNEDCLKGMLRIRDNSIDMILCDLPYGRTKNTWDELIDLEKLWIQYDRIIKENGAIILTAQTPFDKVLGASNIDNLRLDNCMGSGTTAIACLNTNRKYIGFETDVVHYESSLSRIANHCCMLKEVQI